MIVLHKIENDKHSDQLEEKLNNLVLSFKIRIHDVAESKILTFPFIEDDGKEIKDSGEIEKWLRELESDLKWQRSLSGDGCYIDPKSGTVC